MALLAIDRLNDNYLSHDYYMVIQTGTEQLLEFPERKDSLENDWREEDGKERDLGMVRFKAKKVTLQCAFLAPNESEFWAAYDTFFLEITKPGWQDLFINDHGKTYEVAYQKTSGWVKTTKRFKNADRIFVKMKLTFIVK